jgi:hypothetical protein
MYSSFSLVLINCRLAMRCCGNRALLVVTWSYASGCRAAAQVGNPDLTPLVRLDAKEHAEVPAKLTSKPFLILASPDTIPPTSRARCSWTTGLVGVMVRILGIRAELHPSTPIQHSSSLLIIIKQTGRNQIKPDENA